MPSYDYYCAANQQTIEVKHSMQLKLTTWGEVCKHSGQDLGAVSADSPVERLITGGQVVHSSSLKNPEPPACATGGCCGGCEF